MALDTKPFTKPLVLVADTLEQHSSLLRHKRIDSPVMLTRNSFKLLASCMGQLATIAGFSYTKQPAYTIFNDDKFAQHRRTFWKPILNKKFPIYIISPLFGVLWPGDKAGLYNLAMEDVFVVWCRKGMWHVINELYEKNKCDCVISFLPPVYDNTARVEGLPWFQFMPDSFVDNMPVLLKLARNRS